MSKSRWADYVIAMEGRGHDVSTLWSEAHQLGGGQSTYVLGLGFDPRCLQGLRAFLTTANRSAVNVVAIELPPASEHADRLPVEFADHNRKEFGELTAGMSITIQDYPSVEEPSSAGPRLTRSVLGLAEVDSSSHILLDISSLPTSLYFALTKGMLDHFQLREVRSSRVQLQVVACENAAIDSVIEERGVAEAVLMGGFRHDFDPTALDDGIRVWTPVLGEGSRPALSAIHELLSPHDTSPVLPFPAGEPRRADRLVLEHKRVLFDQFASPFTSDVTRFDLSPHNFIYVDERNPFDLYRTLLRFQADVKDAFSEIEGPTTVILSAHSSKLLSLGALLAAHERRMPVAAPIVHEYGVRASREDLESRTSSNTLACVWLMGAPYDEK